MPLTFNANAIKTQVKPNINNSKTYLNSASQDLSLMVVPNDFYYHTQLKRTIPNKLKEIIGKVNNINKNVQEQINTFENIDRLNRQAIQNLSVNTIMTSSSSSNNYITPKSSTTNFDNVAKTTKKEEKKSWWEKAGDWLKSAGETIKKTAASWTNGWWGVGKGIIRVGEGIVDAAAVIGTSVATPFTYIYDQITDDDITEDMWDGIMTWVAENQVDNAYDWFYDKTELGKWLDDNAYDYWKSDGAGCKIAEGVGSTITYIALTFVPGGFVVIGTSAAGQAMEDNWAQARDSSWEGIKRMHDKGEISDEEYNSMEIIKTLSDEQWKEIENDYKNGKITKEEFESMKKIREMPDDWKTAENAVKGIFNGVAKGVWDGILSYFGSKAGQEFLNNGSKVAFKTATDKGMDIMDNVFRTGVDSATSDKTFAQAWKDNGGWGSLAFNIALGFGRKY